MKRMTQCCRRNELVKNVCLSAMLSLGIALGAGCNKNEEELKQARSDLEECQSKTAKLQEEINKLKVLLAQALANPGTIKVDPALLQIEGDLEKKPTNVAEGNLNQAEVVSTVTKNKGALKACYDKALKRNSTLHTRQISVTVAFKIRNSGSPASISVRPDYDSQMTECMVKAIERWQFPSFEGAPIDVETPFTFTPKN